MIYLRIESTPVRTFYVDARTLPNLTNTAANHALLQSVGELVSEVNGQNANVGVSLRDVTGTHELMANPPLGCAASLIDTSGDVVFTGIVQSVSLAQGGVNLSLEA